MSTKPTFNNVFAVGLRELQELGTLDDTNAADLLYKLTTGLDRVSLIDVMRDLSDVRRKLYDPHDEASLIPDLVQNAVSSCRTHGGVAERRAAMDRTAGAVGRDGGAEELVQRPASGKNKRKCSTWRSVCANCGAARRPAANNWRRSVSCRRFPTRRSNAWNRCGKQMEENDQQVTQLERRRREFRREVAAQPINEDLWSQAARIEVLVEMGPWIANLQTQIEADAGRNERHGDAPGRLVGQVGLRDERAASCSPSSRPAPLPRCSGPRVRCGRKPNG